MTDKAPQSRDNKSPHSGWLNHAIIKELHIIKIEQKISIQRQIELGAWFILKKYSELPDNELKKLKKLLNI